MSTPYKTFSYFTFGCKVNFADSSFIARELIDSGYNQIPFEDKADLCLINTCSVTDNADKKAEKLINSINNKYPETKIIVYGCFAQLKPEKILSIKGVNAVIGTKDKFSLKNIVENQNLSKVKFTSNIDKAELFNISYSLNERTRAFVKIQDGCDYNCSFCTIPLARGKSRSLNVVDTINEIKNVLKSGTQEIIISGINLGDFGILHNQNLEMLLLELEKLKSLKRYRLSSIEPNLFSDNIIDIIKNSKKVMPHFHIPLQSGSDKILKLMQRRYTAELYTNLISKIKYSIPNACIGVDVIVGFPNESNDDYLKTYNLLLELDVSYLHVFTFSERENTKAEEEIFPKIDNQTKVYRRNHLRQLSSKKYMNFIKKYKGQSFNVLFEKFENNTLSGWSENYIKVKVNNNKNLINTIKKVELVEFDNNEAYGLIK